MVREFLQEEFGHDAIISVRVSWCTNPVTNNMLPFDMIIGPLNIICEVDGIQHFEEVLYFKTSTLRQRKARDGYKEVKAIEMVSV